MSWPFIILESLPEKTMTFECNTKRVNVNHFQLTQRMNKEWAEHKLIRDSCPALRAMQMTLNDSGVSTQKFPSMLKRNQKHVQKSKFYTQNSGKPLNPKMLN
jgi:hypothetical protein